MKKHFPLFLFASLLSVSGCALPISSQNPSGTSQNATSEASGNVATSTTTSPNDGTSDSPTYAAFWAAGSAASLSLSFSNAALYALSDYGANYSQKYADVYFPCTFTATLGGKSYSLAEVGARMKGATSRTTICTSGGVINDVCHFKLKFNCTFDDDLYDLSQFTSFKKSWADSAARKSRKARTFAEMEKLDLKYLPRNDSDQTYSQDIYCYSMFNTFGVEAPNARWVALTFKDAASSKTNAYEAVESIDESFLDRHYGESTGDLYKCTQVIFSSGGFGGANYTKADLALSGAVSTAKDANGYANGQRTAKGKIGVEDNYTGYHPNYSLKTNDKNGESSDFSKMANLINVAYSLRYAKAPYSLLDQTLDVNQFLNFEAISYLLGNFDDQRNNYNNYYVYFRSSDGKAVYIPYDWDYSLGANKGVDVSSFKPFYSGSAHDSSNGNNLYWDTILTNSSLAYASTSQKSMQATYKAAISNALAKGVLTYSNYTSFLAGLANRVAAQSEESLVANYMSKRLSVLSGY